MSKINISVKTNVIFDIQRDFCCVPWNWMVNKMMHKKKRFVKVSKKDPVQNFFEFLVLNEIDCSMYDLNCSV